MASRKKETQYNDSTTKITDFYKSPIKIRLVKEGGVLRVKEEPSLDSSLHSSSVLLTPDASPNKDKDSTTPNQNTNNNNYSEQQLSLKLSQVCSPVKNMCRFCKTSGISLVDQLDNTTFKDLPETKSCHCKQIITDADDFETVDETASKTTIPATPQPGQQPTSQPKKRRGRKAKSANPALTVVKSESESQPKPKTSRKKKSEPEIFNKTITDYFPVRRSGRRCKSEIEKERALEYEDKVLSQCTDGLKVTDIPGKGRGVTANKIFKKGDFVVEYEGDLIDLAESKDREEFYGMSTKFGCYMYYFTMKGKHYCIDATLESGKLGRLLNHSRLNGNCCTKLIEIKNRPSLILIASRDIVKGEELLYDYGDRSKESLEAHPWLKL